MFRVLLRLATAASLVCVSTMVADSGLRAQQVGRFPLEIRPGGAPAAVTALGRTHLAYELHLTNFASYPVTVGRLEVIDMAGSILASWSDGALRQRLMVVGTTTAGDTPGGPARLAAGARAVAFLWVALESGMPIPKALRHRVTLRASDNEDGAVVTTGIVAVRPDEASALAPPVASGPWVAVRGASPTSGHRLSLVALQGGVRIPQRFAVDWLRLGTDGLAFRGEGRDVADWFGYGAPVLAVGSGTVVLVRDGFADTPVRSTPPATISAEEAPGNVVVLDLGGGRYAAYAHLKAGSLLVKHGDPVTTGQPLGQIGNSGNSLGPHLHFQVSDGIEPLASEGLPFSIDHFELIGRLSGLGPLLSGTPWTRQAAQPARPLVAELPLENMVVMFGS